MKFCLGNSGVPYVSSLHCNQHEYEYLLLKVPLKYRRIEHVNENACIHIYTSNTFMCITVMFCNINLFDIKD